MMLSIPGIFKGYKGTRLAISPVAGNTTTAKDVRESESTDALHAKPSPLLASSITMGGKTVSKSVEIIPMPPSALPKSERPDFGSSTESIRTPSWPNHGSEPKSRKRSAKFKTGVGLGGGGVAVAIIITVVRVAIAAGDVKAANDVASSTDPFDPDPTSALGVLPTQALVPTGFDLPSFASAIALPTPSPVVNGRSAADDFQPQEGLQGQEDGWQGSAHLRVSRKLKARVQ